MTKQHRKRQLPGYRLAAVALTTLLAVAFLPATAAQAKTLSEARNDLERIETEWNSTNSDIEAITESLELLQSDIADSERELGWKRETLDGTMRASYKEQAKASPLDLVADASSISELVEAARNRNELDAAYSDTICDALEILDSLNAQRTDEEAKKGELDAKLAELESQREDTQELIAELEEEERREAERRYSEMLAAQQAVDAYTSSYTPSSTPSVLADVIEDARQFIGYPYVYGAMGPDSFDCSGFVNFIYARHGLPTGGRTVSDIIYALQSTGRWRTSFDELVPGDMVCSSESHVGIYTGNGCFVQAQRPGVGVQEVPMTWGFIGGGHL